ncbi:putative Serine/threonine protein kinase with TPR repeats [Candidatus Sulfopaludibacter sp. SbA3]|nr:putative Serine/threonine protein kinase with TPR repeats [Candidatus Sulfopaludibacter sp. SbA3]
MGEGGMGVVYQARDTDLGRYVALKFLSPELVSSPDRIARFRKEARAISTLNHPRIATIYGIEDTGDLMFLVLEYLPGGTLRQKLLARKSLGDLPSLHRCVEWAIQIAEGLSHAHQHAIVHRDIKSSNVLFTEDGQIKIADFGLAKIAASRNAGAASELETVSGHAMGTPVYMSPEQARGQEVDERSDIFSLGVLLFELIAGQVPFHSTDTPAVLHDIAYTPAPALRQFREDVPDRLQSIVSRMLEKDPARRYQTAKEVLADLRAFNAGMESDAPHSSAETVTLETSPRRKQRWWLLVAAALLLGLLAGVAVPGARHRVAARIFPPHIPSEKRVAVLRFTNIGGDPSNQALCDGLFEEVSNAITRLERFHGSLLVVPAADVRKDDVTSVRQAGITFGANLAITGSVQRLGADGIQVMMSLSDAHTVTQLRAETIRTDLADLVDVQEQVVAKIAGMLELDLQPEAAQSLKATNTAVPAAYPSYVEGAGYLYRYDQPDNIGKAIGAFRKSVARDPRFALAFSGLAEAFKRQYDLLKDPKLIDDALENSSRALALNDQLPAAHVTMGMIQAAKGESKRAEKEFHAALKLDPLNADAYRELAGTYRAMNRPAQAEATYQRAIELRHDDWWSVKQLGVFYFITGRFEKAEQCFREVIRLTPDSAKAYSNLGGTYVKMGRTKDAIEQFQKSLSLGPTSDDHDNLGYLYYYDGNYAQAAVQFQKAIDLAPANSEFWGNLADSYRWDPGLAAKAPDTYRHAIELIQREITVNPRDGELHSQVATWWAAMGRRKEAISEIGKAIQLAPFDGDVQFHAALVYEQAGQRDRALRAVQAALKAGYTSNEFSKAPPLQRLRQDPGYVRLVGAGNPTH